MSMNMSNMVLLAMKQTAKGTPAAPVPGTHAILCRGLTPQPIKGKFVERNLIRGSKGNQGALFTKAARHALEPVWAADTQRRINAMGLWPKNLPYPRAALDT